MEKNIEKKAIEIGAKLIENGAEISRAEDTITRILQSQGISNINVFCLNSLIILSTENTVKVERIRYNDLNLYMIDELNAQSRSICNNEVYRQKEFHYNPLLQIILIILATGSFCIYFGGTIYDALFSGIIGIAITFKAKIIDNIFASTLIDSIIAGLLSYLPTLIGIPSHPGKIMIGTIMLLIPGLTVGNAMRDIMNSDVLSGIIELTQAIFTALAIALGFSVAVIIFGYD